MSPDRRKDDDDNGAGRKELARIKLTSRPPETEVKSRRGRIGEAIEEEDDDKLSIVERKRLDSQRALQRLERARAAQAEEDAIADAEEQAQREVFERAQQAVVERDAARRMRDSDRAMERTKRLSSQPPPPASSRSVERVTVRPSVPAREVAQEARPLPLSAVVQRMAEGTQRALEEPKKTRDEAFRFLKRLRERVEGRFALKGRLKEVINKPESVSAIVTLAIEVNQFASLLRSLDDTSQNLEMDQNGVPVCNPRNTDRMGRELAKAEDSIHKIPSDPPIAMSREADIDTNGLMPEKQLIGEFAKLLNTSPEETRAEEFSGLFKKIDSHLATIIEWATKNVGLDAGFTLRAIITFRQDLVDIARITKMTAAQGIAPPLETREKWSKGVKKLAEVVTMMLAKADALYKPTYENLVGQLDYDALQKELRMLQDKLGEVESRMSAGQEGGEENPWKRIRKGVQSVFPGRQQTSNFMSRRQLEVEEDRLKRRIAGVQGIMRLHMHMGMSDKKNA